MTFNSDKRSDTKPDVIQYRAQTAALGAFNQALLFQSAMIHLNAPRRFGLRFSLGFGHLSKQYSDVPSVARMRNNLIPPNPLSHTTVPFPPPSPASETARNPLRLTLICRFSFKRVRKCQPKERTGFKFSIEPYQLSRTFHLRIKSAPVRCQQHFGKMVASWFCRCGLYQTGDNQSAHIARRSSRAR